MINAFHRILFESYSSKSLGRLMTMAAVPGVSLAWTGPNWILVLLHGSTGRLGAVVSLSYREVSNVRLYALDWSPHFQIIKGASSENIFHKCVPQIRKQNCRFQIRSLVSVAERPVVSLRCCNSVVHWQKARVDFKERFVNFERHAVIIVKLAPILSAAVFELISKTSEKLLRVNAKIDHF